MKRDLALRLLSNILPNPPWDESRSQEFFKELEILAEHKYNTYEMYQPGRLFFENLYLWLLGFEPEERTTALQFVRENLIFISRGEFQQLAQVLYFDKILHRQLDITSERTGIPRFRVRRLARSVELQRIKRASLYVALSDGARIDYFRRQNLSITNEQVLPIYYPSEEKVANILTELEKSLGQDARFDCLFLIDDFCGSGRTLLREFVKVSPVRSLASLTIPPELSAYISYNEAKNELRLNWAQTLSEPIKSSLLSLCEDYAYTGAIQTLIEKVESKQTELDGSLKRLAEGYLATLVTEKSRIFLCPLLTTEYAIRQMQPLLQRLPSPFNGLEFLPGAVLPDSVRIKPSDDCGQSNPTISTLCCKYYRDDLADKHTGDIKFGYDACGLPLVLHHNTPNNSIYLLWSRRLSNPLFVRYERHGREAIG